MRWPILMALPIVAGCATPPHQASPPYPANRPAAVAAPERPTRTPDRDASAAMPSRAERYSGQFDGGRITLAISPLGGGRVQVVASSPRQPSCTIEWRTTGTWSGDVLPLQNGITLRRVGATLEMTEGEGGSPSCTLQGTLRRL